MKRVIKCVLCFFILIVYSFSFCISAFAEDIVRSEEPTSNECKLSAVSFTNGSINEPFSKDRFEYTFTLENESVKPKLESYEITSGNLFVNYETDETGVDRGIVAVVTDGTTESRYRFAYSNLTDIETNSDNSLESIEFNCAYLEDDIRKDLKQYKLYIPNDLTVLNIYPTAHDGNAVCSGPFEFVLDEKQQQPVIISVVASDKTVKEYKFKIHRVDLTQKEFQKCLLDGDFEKIVKSKPFLTGPPLYIAIISTVCGLIVVFACLFLAKKYLINTDKPDNASFFNGENTM